MTAALPEIRTRLLKAKGKNAGPKLFANLGEQLLAIRHSAINPLRRIDPRLVELQRRAAAAGGSEAVPGDGGFLIQPSFSKKILRRMYRVGDILSRCHIIPVTQPNTNAARIPQFDESSRASGSRLGGVSAYWQNEADQIIASKPKFLASELVTHKMTGLIYLTDELLQDSDALANWCTYALAQELTFTLENAIVAGSGAGEPLGVLNSGALVTVAKESTQAAGTVVSTNIGKMLQSFWSASFLSDGAVWLYHQDLLPQLAALQTAVGTGGGESKLWQWATSPDSYDMLGGFAAIPSEYCSVPGTPGDIILCDFSRYIVAMRELIRNELSLHLLFIEDEAAFRAVWRVNGQPLDARPVTPLNGSTPTSSFVALAAR